MSSSICCKCWPRPKRPRPPLTWPTGMPSLAAVLKRRPLGKRASAERSHATVTIVDVCRPRPAPPPCAQRPAGIESRGAPAHQPAVSAARGTAPASAQNDPHARSRTRACDHARHPSRVEPRRPHLCVHGCGYPAGRRLRHVDQHVLPLCVLQRAPPRRVGCRTAPRLTPSPLVLAPLLPPGRAHC